MEKSLPIQRENKMPYNEYGDWIDEQEEMDKTFKLLANDQELNEDDLRESVVITGLVKELVLDTGSTEWDDLVNACDERFGTLESRIEEQERALAFAKKIHERLRNEA